MNKCFPALLLMTVLALPAAAAHAQTRHHASSHSTHSVVHSTHSGKHSSRSHRVAAPAHSAASHAPMSEERATAIQSALIQRGYLTGAPTGHWDEASIEATRKLQQDNGWQTKIVPDSRALIKLGLGPEAAADRTVTPTKPIAPGTAASNQPATGEFQPHSVAPPPVSPQAMQ